MALWPRLAVSADACLPRALVSRRPEITARWLQTLLRSYFATVCRVPTHTGAIRASLDGEIVQDFSALPELLTRRFAVLTAYNPRSMLLPRRVNEQRHFVLRDLLILGCYRVEPSVGSEAEPEGVWREPAYLVQRQWIARRPSRSAASSGRTPSLYAQNGRPELIVTDPTADDVGRTFQGNWRVRTYGPRRPCETPGSSLSLGPPSSPPPPRAAARRRSPSATAWSPSSTPAWSAWRRLPKNEADPTGVSDLRAMADSMDKVAGEAAAVQLTLPELKKLRDEYQRMAKDIAKAERDARPLAAQDQAAAGSEPEKKAAALTRRNAAETTLDTAVKQEAPAGGLDQQVLPDVPLSRGPPARGGGRGGRAMNPPVKRKLGHLLAEQLLQAAQHGVARLHPELAPQYVSSASLPSLSCTTSCTVRTPRGSA